MSFQVAEGLVSLIADLAIGGVMEQCDVVLPTECYRRDEVFFAGSGTGGVIWVIKPHQLGVPGYVGWDGVQLGQPAVLLVQRHDVTLGPGEHRAHAVDRVSRIRDQGDVARVQEAESSVPDALFCADQW